MKSFQPHVMLPLLLVLAALTPAPAQSLDKLNLQFHGYATQAFVYSNQNNWNTTNSTGGSLAWTEGVANVTALPHPRLRLGAQVRYFRLGNYGNNVTFDWASAEFRIDERFAIRAGKVKTPAGLLNEIQDIDPAQLWILLPSAVYPIAGRDATLTHNGVIGLGTFALGEKFGKLEYRVFAGERALPAGDGYLDPLSVSGVSAPHGLKGRTYGGSLRWRTPLPGLVVGAADASVKLSGPTTYGPYPGTLVTQPLNDPFIFAQYERRNLMLAGEYNRLAASGTVAFPGVFTANSAQDQRNFYAMLSYKFASKVTAGAYYSSSLDRKAAFTSNRYQKDWTLAGRYELSSFLYLKLEQHFVDGTLSGYSLSNNAGGLAEATRLSLAKLGVSF